MTTNIAASVHQRLLNYARAQGRTFNEVLQLYALHRFLYRLGVSAYREHFVLKGALMLAVWQSPVSRPTRDIDLLGHMDSSPETVAASIREMCAITGEGDGLRYDPDSVSAERIMEGASYAGVRVRFAGYLGNARIPMQIDVGFGDALVPGPSDIELPSLLDLAPAFVRGYSPESAIAEKLQIMVALGEINSRMKDTYDIWLLSTTRAFQGQLLAEAIQATFARRNTPLVWPIAALESSFATEQRKAQWRAFMRRSRLDEPEHLLDALAVLSGFLKPVIQAAASDGVSAMQWEAGGPWRTAR